MAEKCILRIARDELYEIEAEYKKYAEKAAIEELSIIEVAGKENLSDLLGRLQEVVFVFEPVKKKYKSLYYRGLHLYNILSSI